MKKIALILLTSIAITSCGNAAYQCQCTDADGKQVADYELKMSDKKTAQFECGQKSIPLNNNANKDVICNIK